MCSCLEKDFVSLLVLFSLRFDQESSPENRLYLDCFCVVARGIGVSHDYITMVAGSFLVQTEEPEARPSMFCHCTIMGCDLDIMFHVSN